MNGGSTDANAFLFKGGYDSVLKPLYKNGTFKKGPDQFVPGWNNQTAGTIFDQMLVKTGNKIDAVAVANDGMAGAVIASLQKHGLKPIPVTGQDATPQGFQNIISGWQTMTVWKDTRMLAKVAAQAAVALINGQTPKTTCAGSVGCKNGPWRTVRREPAYIIPPVALYKIELEEDLHLRLPQEERHLHRDVQEVLLALTSTQQWGARKGAPLREEPIP